MPALLNTFGATEFESVVLGAPSLEAGIAFLRDKTGLTATPLPTPDGAWNRSAILRLTTGAHVEVLAPNLGHHHRNHLGVELTKFRQPQLIVWTVQTRDFTTAGDVAASLDHPFEEVQTTTIDEGDFKQSGKVARLGPGENMLRPFISAYDFPTVFPGDTAATCLATALHLSEWDAPRLNRLMAGLGLTLKATTGEPALRLDLETPNGPVTLESGDWIKGGMGQTMARLGRHIGNMFRRR